MDNALQTIFAVGGVILFIVFAILIALYVIESLALYTLAKNNGHQHKAVLAWIPFPIVTARVSGFLFYIVAICGITVAYFTLNGLYKKMRNSSDPTVIAVLSAIIPLIRIIYVFIHRNDIFEEDGVVVE